MFETLNVWSFRRQETTTLRIIASAQDQTKRWATSNKRRKTSHIINLNMVMGGNTQPPFFRMITITVFTMVPGFPKEPKPLTLQATLWLPMAEVRENATQRTQKKEDLSLAMVMNDVCRLFMFVFVFFFVCFFFWIVVMADAALTCSYLFVCACFGFHLTLVAEMVWWFWCRCVSA